MTGRPRKAYTATAPGRICLFGEHQDYLGLPVIAAAIGLRFSVEVLLEDSALHRYRIVMPDLEREELIHTAMPLVYQHGRDYLRSAMKILRKDGIELPGALTAVFRSTIPIQAGTSSSTAMSMAWIAALLHGADREDRLNPLQVARYSHASEVVEFKESGGMMDQLSIAYGGICHIDFAAGEPVTPLKARPVGWVLGDSCQPKDTLEILRRVRSAAEGAMRKIRAVLPGFDLKATPFDEAAEAAPSCLEKEEQRALLGNLQNRDILRKALELLSRDSLDSGALGALLSAHHEILRDQLGISTPKIEAMMDAAMAAGALGGKINGSGGGGCLFVLAPGREGEAAEALERAGGRAFPVPIDEGIRVA